MWQTEKRRGPTTKLEEEGRLESPDFWNKKCRDFFKNERDIFKTFSSSACRAAFAINYSMRVYAARVSLSSPPLSLSSTFGSLLFTVD
jgi:hypothetical protein